MREYDIQNEVSNLSSKKTGTFGNNSTKVLKDSSNICDLILQDIRNYEILGKQYFTKNLKLADITPLYKKKTQFYLRIIDLSAYFFVFFKSWKE